MDPTGNSLIDCTMKRRPSSFGPVTQPTTPPFRYSDLFSPFERRASARGLITIEEIFHLGETVPPFSFLPSDLLLLPRSFQGEVSADEWRVYIYIASESMYSSLVFLRIFTEWNCKMIRNDEGFQGMRILKFHSGNSTCFRRWKILFFISMIIESEGKRSSSKNLSRVLWSMFLSFLQDRIYIDLVNPNRSSLTISRSY